MAEKEEFDHKLKEIEHTCSPIITRLYQSGQQPSGSAGGAGASGGGNAQGPKIEEVD